MRRGIQSLELFRRTAARRALRRCAVGGAVIVACLAPSLASADNNQQNDANNPLTRKIAVQTQDYVQPVLSGRPGEGANQFLLRSVVPHDTLGFSQIARASMPVVASSWGPRGAWNGIGDLTIFDMALLSVGKGEVGAGPLVVAPTASAPALGPGKWQWGVQSVLSVPHAWGLTSLLSSYQQSFEGTLQTLTVQPLLFLNLADGYYLRSTGLATFNLGVNSVVPVGLGLGRAFDVDNGRVLNLFVEPQYSVVQTGPGVPSFQVYVGANLQFPVKK